MQTLLSSRVFDYFDARIMAKKIILGFTLVITLLVLLLAWMIAGPGTAFDGKNAIFYIPTKNKGKETVEQGMQEKHLLAYSMVFNWLATQTDYWDHIHPGQYEIKKGMSNLDMIRMLKNGRQSPVNLVINKFRTREDLAGFLGRKI